MIISASYKTDIPAFYGEWFSNRLSEGYCLVRNPYNGTFARISLARADVDGIVFWTKNVGPFLSQLSRIRDMGYPFLVQHTINGYPRALESRVTDANRSVDHLRQISSEFGPRVAVWRYDTIVLSTLTPFDFHVSNFARLALALSGVCNEVVVSFVQLYKKTTRNLNRAAEEHGFSWSDPEESEKRALLSELVRIGSAEGLTVSVCSQPQLLVPGAHEARCIDARRLQAVAGRSVQAPLRGNRKECGCFESRDIGDYDTCPHGCVYCYAVRDDALAKRRFAEHDAASNSLFPVPANAKISPAKNRALIELPLFPS